VGDRRFDDVHPRVDRRAVLRFRDDLTAALTCRSQGIATGQSKDAIAAAGPEAT
jgi:hypothetical protein